MTWHLGTTTVDERDTNRHHSARDIGALALGGRYRPRSGFRDVKFHPILKARTLIVIAMATDLADAAAKSAQKVAPEGELGKTIIDKLPGLKPPILDSPARSHLRLCPASCNNIPADAWRHKFKIFRVTDLRRGLRQRRNRFNDATDNPQPFTCLVLTSGLGP